MLNYQEILYDRRMTNPNEPGCYWHVVNKHDRISDSLMTLEMALDKYPSAVIAQRGLDNYQAHQKSLVRQRTVV